MGDQRFLFLVLIWVLAEEEVLRVHDFQWFTNNFEVGRLYFLKKTLLVAEWLNPGKKSSKMEEEYLQSVIELDDLLSRGAPHKQVQQGQIVDLITFVLE